MFLGHVFPDTTIKTYPLILEFRGSIYVDKLFRYDKIDYRNSLFAAASVYQTDQSSRGMPILAHNEKLFYLKKQVIMLYEIYSIKNYHHNIINTIIILLLKLYTHGSSK